MKPSAQLFELIRAMSASEKRYFRLFAQRHVIGEQNIYLKLFNAVERQEEYDEKQILEKLSSVLSKKKISFAKNYLYTLILESLRLFHSGKTVDIQLREALTDINILFSRQLYSHCEKIISKMLPLAEQHEKFFEYIRLLEMYVDVLRRSNQTQRLEKEIEDILKNIEKTIKLTDNAYKYYAISILSSLAILKYNYTQKNDIWQDIRTEFEPYSNDISQTLTWQSKLFFYQYKIGYGQQFADLEAIRNYSLHAIEHFHQFPWMIPQYLYAYTGIVRNLLHSYRMKDEFDEARKYLDILKDIPSKYPEYMTEFLDIYIFSHSSQLELYIAFVERDKEKILTFVDRISEGLERFKGKIPALELYPLRANIALCLYDLNLMPEALKFVNAAINSPDPNLTPFAQTIIRMLAIIFHYDMGNFDVIESLIRSTERHNETYKCLSPVSEIFLRLMRRLDRASSPEKKIKAFNSALNELKAVDQALQDEHFLTPLFYEWFEKNLTLLSKNALI